MSGPLLGIAFALAAAVSLAASWRLVVSLERVGARIGLSEALLGMLAALAADAPEITAAVTALIHHDQHIGAGVVIGSNVFNLAALIGLAGIVAGTVALHRRAIELAGALALWIATVTLAAVLNILAPALALALVLAVMVPYLALLGLPHERLARLPFLPSTWRRWLLAAVTEEELELEVAIHPTRGHARDIALAAGAVVVVLGASIAMEESAATLGARHAIPGILIGGLLLAGVTSLPNAVAGVYLAARGRAAACLSTALNSNAINVLAGLLIPTTILGLAPASTPTTFIAASYLAMTALVIVATHRHQALTRRAGIAIVTGYLLFAVALTFLAT